MKHTVWTVTVVLILAVAAAGQTKVKNHKKHSGMVKAARTQGRCALVILSSDTKSIRADQAAKQLDTELFKQLVNKYFVLRRSKANEDDPLWQKYKDNFPEDKEPYWMVVTPQLELVAGGTREDITAANDSWFRRLRQIGEDHPPISKDDRKKAEEMLEEAWESLQEGRYYETAKTAKELYELVWYPPSVQLGSERLLERIELQGEQQLRRARALREKDPVRAAQAYQEIIDQFTTELQPGSDAEEELQQLLRKDQETARKLDELEREQRARKLLEKAQAEEEKDNPRSAAGLYRTIIRGYDDTESFKPANEALARLDPRYTPRTQPTSRPTTQPTTATSRPTTTQPAGQDEQQRNDSPNADEQAAQSLLKVAHNLHAAGMTDRAGDKLMECMRDYPGTEAAETAASLYVEWGLEQ
ncbi:MAG: hypothetical protein ACLFVW_08700 [Phycisphaerae bacterium]